MRPKKWKEEDLIKAVKECHSFSDVMRAINLGDNSGNRDTINRWIKKLELDTSHFNGGQRGESFRKMVNSKKLNISDVLVANCKHSRASVRRIILRNELIPYKCEGCDLEGQWRGEPLSLQLEHKNGINDDNRIENLCWLCPNCHSQTSTYAGKKLKTIDKKCEVCNKNLHCKAKTSRCKKHQEATVARKVERPSLSQLLADIRALGYSGTGRKYGVSHTSIRRWIEYEQRCQMENSARMVL